MILQNKVFIDDSIINSKKFSIDDRDDYTEIFIENTNKVKVLFTEEKISIDIGNIIYYSKIRNTITFYDGYDKLFYIGEKVIHEDEIISIELQNEDFEEIVINITTMKIPAFLLQDNTDNKYPKFEINISDCVYNMKIYTDDSTYLGIPNFQSHADIRSTLEYISDLVFYLTLGRPDFIEKLCNHEKIDLLVYDKDHTKAVSGGQMDYKLGEEGLYLSGGDLQDYLVEWQKFFKLVMDQTWEVDFIE